ncbi:MAG TPA: VOC family protein [Burkholderiales bacterium]|nr:VOC family protein [Burkholderiales bacterium]
MLPDVKWVGVMHEGVPCRRSDLDACIKFYQEVLGLKLLPRPARLDEIMGYKPSGAWLGDADDKVQFHLIAKDDEVMPGPDAARSPTGRHTAWLVKDLNALRARLRELGMDYNEIAGVVASDQLFVKDPSGFTWEFQEVR